MRFVKPLAAALMLAWLAGCSSTPPEPQAPTGEPEAGQPQGPFNAALPPGPVTLNPYLETPAPKVDSATRQRFDQAREQMQRQQWSEARQSLQNLVAEAPELSGPWLNLGIVWVQLNEPGQARAAFSRALAANPLNVDAYNHLAALERREGHFDEARTLYQQALAVWPHSIATHKNLGILLDIYLGEWDEALLHYEAAQYLTEQREGAADATLAGWIIDLKRRMAAGEGA
ncbi:tetratricopeptide repeat protein [Gilvimarinus algae]|uniref:Tetratricopeptide repeat protein n=1 Tax=Gilvimarinus algae TaxID=3058037 RepID=A0ABT8TBM9_9GAMM|nr:tetratricopeptide repeat protein [Gilvimarinus sp. SDUM040014]MDO3381511.1 tetratricopeptide repeat protein [Gilvimarinus sp. SDUM040014]